MFFRSILADCSSLLGFHVYMITVFCLICSDIADICELSRCAHTHAPREPGYPRICVHHCNFLSYFYYEMSYSVHVFWVLSFILSLCQLVSIALVYLLQIVKLEYSCRGISCDFAVSICSQRFHVVQLTFMFVLFT